MAEVETRLFITSLMKKMIITELLIVIAKDKKEGLIGPDGYYIHADSLEKIAEEG